MPETFKETGVLTVSSMQTTDVNEDGAANCRWGSHASRHTDRPMLLSKQIFLGKK